MNTIIFNTSNRMLPLIKKIHEVSNLKLCIVKNDVKVGRKKTLQENIVKTWCTNNKIEYLQIDNLKDKNLQKVIDKLSTINFDIGIVVDFNFIIPNVLLNTYKNKLFNIHYSLLPKYRGASPIQFAILNNDIETGITYQRVHKEMDKGNVIESHKVNIENSDTSEALFNKLLKINIDTIENFLAGQKNNSYNEITQNELDATYTYSKTNPKKTIIFKQDAFSDLTENKQKIYAKIRAFYPWPILHTNIETFANYNNLILKENTDKDLIIKIYSANLKEDKLVFETIQVQGKQKTDFNSFVNGYCIKDKS